MEITFFAPAGFKIKSKSVTVFCDPANLKIDDFVINRPGEYEVKGVTVFGTTVGEKVVYNMVIDGVRVCYTEGQINKTDIVDILLLPAKIDEAIIQLEPKVVVLLKGPAEIPPVSKFNITAEKLPETTTTVVLE